MANFKKLKLTTKIVLPDQSILIGQKLTENAKMPNMKWDILGDFKQCAACAELFFVNQWAFFAIFSQYKKATIYHANKKRYTTTYVCCNFVC